MNVSQATWRKGEEGSVLVTVNVPEESRLSLTKSGEEGPSNNFREPRANENPPAL